MELLKTNQSFLTFTKEGWVDYSGEELGPPTSYQPLFFETFDWKSLAQGAERNKHIPLVISGIYISLIFGLQALMKNRKPFNLVRELALWNGMLGLFSILGFIRVFPDFWGKINRSNGLHLALCVKDEISIPMAFWAAAFIVSKIVELGDTIFIVLRKRPVQFLQWFHHALSLTLAWTTGPYLEPICRFYILMNYGVHALMYPYFCARAFNIHVPKPVANTITLLQFAQMIVGVGINIYTSYIYYFVGGCDRHPFSIKMIWLSYGSFLILFGDLFYRLVLKKDKRKSD